MKLVFAAILLVISATLVAAQPGATTGSPPAFKIVSNFDKNKGHVFILETVYKPVHVVVERAVIVNGKQETVKETRTEIVAEQRTLLIEMTNSRVITPDGKQLPIDDVWQRLKVNGVIVMSADGKTPAQAYLRALNPETLVLIPGTPAQPKVEPQPKKLP